MNSEQLLARVALKIETQRKEYELLSAYHKDNVYLKMYYGAIIESLGKVMQSIAEVLNEVK